MLRHPAGAEGFREPPKGCSNELPLLAFTFLMFSSLFMLLAFHLLPFHVPPHVLSSHLF